MARVVLIVNPYSSGVAGDRLAAVEAELAAVADVEVEPTRGPGHATELAARAAGSGADAIVVYSGDGTYNEAVNGAAGRVPFGFVPGGGASVFPRSPPAGRARSRSAGSTAGASSSPPGSVSTPRRCAASRSAAAEPTGAGRATSSTG